MACEILSYARAYIVKCVVTFGLLVQCTAVEMVI